MKQYKSEGIEVRIHKRNKVMPHNVLAKEDYERVKDFMSFMQRHSRVASHKAGDQMSFFSPQTALKSVCTEPMKLLLKKVDSDAFHSALLDKHGWIFAHILQP